MSDLPEPTISISPTFTVPSFVHKAFSGAVLGALVVVVGVMPQLHRSEASSDLVIIT